MTPPVKVTTPQQEIDRANPPELLAIFIDATEQIADLDRQRGEQTVRRRLALVGLQAQGWSQQRIADASGRSKAAIGQIAKSAKN